MAMTTSSKVSPDSLLAFTRRSVNALPVQGVFMKLTPRHLERARIPMSNTRCRTNNLFDTSPKQLRCYHPWHGLFNAHSASSSFCRSSSSLWPVGRALHQSYSPPTGMATWEIYSVRADGRGEEQNLTKSPRDEFSPSLSPNGRYVAFPVGRQR